MNDELI